MQLNLGANVIYMLAVFYEVKVIYLVSFPLGNALIFHALLQFYLIPIGVLVMLSVDEREEESKASKITAIQNACDRL